MSLQKKVSLPIISFVFCVLQLTTAYAIGLEEMPTVLTGSLGVHFSKFDDSKTFSLLPPFVNTYVDNGNSNENLMGGLFIGKQWPAMRELTLVFGIAGYLVDDMDVRGTVVEFGKPEFNKLGYEYRVEHRRVVAEAKFLTILGQHYFPYLVMNAGVAYNKAFGYKETALIEQAVPMAPFADNTEVTFTYTFGAGIEMDVSDTVRAGICVQYVDLGKFALGLSPIQTTTQSIGHNDQNAVELLFQITSLS